MSKKTKTAHPHPRREKKAEKPARKIARPRRVPPKVPPSKPAEKPVEREQEPAERYLVAIRLDGAPTVKHPEELTLNSLRMKT